MFFFKEPPAPEIYTLSLHDALPIYPRLAKVRVFKHYRCQLDAAPAAGEAPAAAPAPDASDAAKPAEAAAKDDAGKDASAAKDGSDGKKAEAPAVRGKTTVPLRYDNGDPAIVIREYGQGKVALVTTTADKQWNDLPEHLAYPLMLHEIVHYLVRPRGASQNLEVGGTFSVSWPPEDFTKEVNVIPPEGHEEEKTSKRPDRVGLFTYAGSGVHGQGVRWAGPYRLTVSGEDRPREIFAVHLPTAESDLSRIEPEEMSRIVKEPAFVTITDPEKLDETIKGRVVGREFWRTLAWTVLTLAVLETFLAWLFGRNRW